MKFTAINGSPRASNGVTWWVLEKFIQGIEDAGEKVQVINLADKKIHHCTGELACWFKTPGKCIHKDDMGEILAGLAPTENLIIATPVYVDGMTGLMKNFFDRIVPCADPHFEMRNGHLRHLERGSIKIKRVALVSVCGFFELDNFNPLVEHIKAICKNMNAEFSGAVLRPAGPMFPEIPTIHPLFFKLRALTKAIKQAGNEFASSGKISAETASAISADVITKEDYFKRANEYFDKASPR